MVTAVAEPKRAEAAGAVRASGQVCKDSAGVVVIGLDRLVELEEVAPVGAGLIVVERRAGRLGLMVNLRHGDEVAMSGKRGGCAANGPGHLEDLRKEDDPRPATTSDRPQDVGAHGAGGRGEFNEIFLNDHPAMVAAASGRLRSMEPPGIYISVPFCRAKCSFCNFASGVWEAERMQGYVDRLCLEIREARAHAERLGFELPRHVDTVYFGGGTPSLLPAAMVGQVFAALRSQFELEHGAEITLECAPGQLEDEALAGSGHEPG